MTSNQQSIKHLYEITANRIGEEINATDWDETGVFRTPELLELLIWNVVIAFVVNITASAVFEALSTKLKQKGRIERADLKISEELIENETISIEKKREGNARRQIYSVLHQYSRTTNLTIPAERIGDILMEAMQDWKEKK